ncbi:FERM domain-containing protein C-like [Trichomycterus rosablanca]|uniref:FERM domain-containing protein C-like n=1 Tax=Trichomycterus rosablanca TaxID=2290929 RepID=UPI002F35A69D
MSLEECEKLQISKMSLQQEQCDIQRLFKSPDAEEAYTTLNKSPDAETTYTTLNFPFINILLQKKLHLSSRKLKEIKVNHLSALLEDPHCTIQNLTLSDCEISDEGYVALAGALMLNPSSHLTHLDLSGNNPGTEGMKMFNDLLKKPNSKLRVRFLSRSSEMDEACDYLNKMGIKMLDLSEVDLSGRRNIGDSGVKHVSTVLKDPHCMITKLILRNCSITDKSCTDLKSALDVNPSHLKDLDLSNNQLGDSGVIQISHLLKNPQFKLHKLTLSDCGVREEGYAALAEALRSNPSSELMELDLRGNHPGDSGVKLLDDLLQNPNCKLKTLRFLKSPEAEEVYTSLCSTLGQNPLILTQMKLERNPGGVSGDSRVKLLSAFLQDSHCKLQKLQINDDDLTMESCSALSEVLRSGSSSLRELDLSNNNLQNSGVQKLCEGLKKNECKLEVLRLSDCGVGDEGYAALAEALRSKRSYMKELDLRGNHPGESGVQKICSACKGGLHKLLTLQSRNFSEMKLRLFKSPDAEEAYTTLSKRLDNRILLQRKLDLSSKTLEEIKANQLSALLEDPHCTIQNLTLCGCRLTENDCTTLVSALSRNPSHLTDLDLSQNPIKDSGVKKLVPLLQNHQNKLKQLNLRNCSITDKSCTDLKSALDVNPSHLKDLDLSNNQLGDSGVIQISHLLKNPQFKLHKLTLSDCGVREEGYAALAEALRSNPSSELMELDLRGNDPGDSGVKLLDDLLQDPNCKLKTLRLLKSPEAEEAYTSLCSTLSQNPLILTQMKLERNPGGVSGDSRVKLLSAFLQDSHCKLQKLQINNDDLTMESCSALSEVLRSGSSSLRELDLSNNRLQNSGVQKLCEGLKKNECKLEVLRLSYCGVGGEGFAALAEALKSNRSYMKELDLRGNLAGGSGVQELCSVCQAEGFNRSEIKLRYDKSVFDYIRRASPIKS